VRAIGEREREKGRRGEGEKGRRGEGEKGRRREGEELKWAN